LVEQATENRRVPSSNLGPGMFKPLFCQGFSHLWLRAFRMGMGRGPSPPPPLPKGAALHRRHRARQRPLPDRADAMGARAPREVPTGFAGTQEGTMEYAERKYPERGARAGISAGVL